jgi:hypothetical protein
MGGPTILVGQPPQSFGFDELRDPLQLGESLLGLLLCQFGWILRVRLQSILHPLRGCLWLEHAFDDRQTSRFCQ